MMNQRLTLIRTARRALEKAMHSIAWTNRDVMDSLKAAQRHLTSAAKFTIDGKPEFAEISMHNACTHMRIILGELA